MSDLPVLPPLDPAVVAAWSAAHRRFAETEAASSTAAVAAARRLFRRLLIEGLAKVQPVLADRQHPLLFPPPRRYLTVSAEQRLAGARAAFAHLDVAAAMHRMDGGPQVVTAYMPPVLNALLAAPVTGRETNPGLLRMTPTYWMADANPFEHPDPDQVPDLLIGAIDLAANAPAPAIARAGWLAFTTMTVHPFVDGNGRTARALFLAIAGAGTDAAIDWGVLEQWSLARDAYVAALQAGQRAQRYAGSDVDPAPFMRFGAETSRHGAELNAARIEMLDRIATAVGPDIGDETDVELLMGVIIDRFVALADLLDESSDPADTTTRVQRLVDEGHVRFGPPPAGRSAALGRGRCLTIGPSSSDLAEELRRTRFSIPHG